MQVRLIAIDELHEDPHNLRIHDERNREDVMRSLSLHGQKQPLDVQHSSMCVIGGNLRLQLLRELGNKKVWCNVIDCTDDEARRLSILFNRSPEHARWDLPGVQQYLDQMRENGDDIADVGFTTTDYDAMFGGWDATDHKVDAMPSEDSPATSVVKVQCLQADKDEVAEYLRRKVAESGFEGAHVV